MHQRFSAITVLVLTVIPAVVSAQEHETALSPFAGDVGNALWTVVIFVLVVLVLGKFAWGPILDQLKTRENFIHDALSAAKQQKEAAEASLKEYTEKLRAARAEADSIIAQSRTDAERLREEMRSEGKGRGRDNRAERRTPDSSRDRPSAPADPSRGRRSVSDDRVQTHPTQSLEGRQREADRGCASTSRDSPPLTKPRWQRHQFKRLAPGTS